MKNNLVPDCLVYLFTCFLVYLLKLLTLNTYFCRA